MVDSIKSQVSPAQVRSGPKESPKPGAQSLRDNFKTVSTGGEATQVARESATTVQIRKREDGPQVGKLANTLNDAVKFSNEALKAIERVSDSDSPGENTEVVQEFANDLDRLKSDIVDLLSDLRSRADRAGIIGANIEASSPQLEDVAKAQERAKSISFDVDQALGAHGEGLTIDRVAELLAD
jgi:hypothetical protein